jgi:hypothetical protein
MLFLPLEPCVRSHAIQDRGAPGVINATERIVAAGPPGRRGLNGPLLPYEEHGGRPIDRYCHGAYGRWDVRLSAMGLFTLPEARLELARLQPVLAELVLVRADMVELSAALTPGGAPTKLGGLPERKAAEARLNELMTEVQQTGAELKGVAPLLVDFPADLDGEPVLLCWLEGEPSLAWYHRTDLGFAGRRRLT